MLITGARGVGKTTWMLSQLSSNHFLYFSADNPIFSAFPLYDLAEAVFMEGYEGILIDEFEKLFLDENKKTKIFEYKDFKVSFDLKMIAKDVNTVGEKYEKYWLGDEDFSFVSE